MISRKHWVFSAMSLLKIITKGVADQQEIINGLNVFPVADGDTGTNVLSTLQRIVEEMPKSTDGVTPDDVLRQIGQSAVKGARGNSGVILSGMIRGAIAKLRGVDKLSVKALADALSNADIEARKNIAKPQEGTMLTVIREMAMAATRAHEAKMTSLSEVAKLVLDAGILATKETPKILAQLDAKYGENVDSGAYVLSLVAQIIYAYTVDKSASWSNIDIGKPVSNVAAPEQNLNWKPGTPLYCTEFLWFRSRNCRLAQERVMGFLARMGDSVNYLDSWECARIHVHTNLPGKVLAYFSKEGEISEVEVHNMRIQTEENQRKIRAQRREAKRKTPLKPLGVVVAVDGDGVRDLVKSLGADVILESNPDVQAIADAIEEARAEIVVVLPSNKNVIPPAERAEDLTKCPYVVIPTKNMPQSAQALTMMKCVLDGNDDEGLAVEEVISMMEAAALSPELRVLSVSKAAKDYQDPTTGVSVRAGQMLLMSGEVILEGFSSGIQAVEAAIEYLTRGKVIEYLRVILGRDMSDSLGEVGDYIRKRFGPESGIEAELLYGSQGMQVATVEVRVMEE